ncbi:MAG: GNAT family N-acetyltransferase [Alphaproteobacteria bacterium]|nr:GNAT family N-acetyltransferase [Alphaproteobacteria bacterium]
MSVVVTPRLILRPLSPSDADAYVAMRFHPGVAQWLPASAGDPLKRVQATIAAFADDWRTRGYAPWGAFERVALGGDVAREGRLVGHVGLRFLPEFDGTEVLYAFLPDLHGKGYAREAAAASLDFGFDVVGVPSILAITLETNVRSWGLMQRLGMTRGPDGHYKGLDVVRYDIDVASWRARRS